jgi:hypothetical protein
MDPAEREWTVKAPHFAHDYEVPAGHETRTVTTEPSVKSSTSSIAMSAAVHTRRS